MSRRRRSGLLGLLLSAVAGPSLAQGLYFEGGVSLARGDYVYEQQTSSGGAAAGLAWSGRRFTLRATLPYFVHGTTLSTESGAPAPEVPDAAAPESGHEGGVSDPVVQAYAQLLESGRTGVGLSASVKVPAVAAGAFGTGEWDFGGGLSLSRFVGPATMLGLDLSYWHLGDMPDLALQDTVTGTLTVGRSLGRSWLASVSVSGSRSSLAGYAAPWWASVLVSRASPAGILGLTASLGLSATAPDVTVGVVWRVRLRSDEARAAGAAAAATARAPRPPAPGS